MKKVGLITFHCAYNYGAILQAYALQTKIESLGYLAEFIDFRPNVIIDTYKESTFSSGKIAALYKIIKRKKMLSAQTVRKNRNTEFENFVKEYFKLSAEKYTTTAQLEQAKLEYDIYVCGSDQIWNSQYNGNENAYFLSFVKNDLPKIAYAPSFGVGKIPETECERIKPLLNKFAALSVREEQGKLILNNQLKLDATQVLDPTFLLESGKWREFSSHNKVTITRKYIFAYILWDNDAILKKIYQFAKSEKLEIVFVGMGTLLQPTSIPIIDMSDVGPKDFLNLLMNAEYVCTNSFHGMALSILFNKKFVVVFNKSFNSRMESLLKVCGLEDRIFNINNQLQKKYFENVDFNYANAFIKKQREISEKYLIDAFN